MEKVGETIENCIYAVRYTVCRRRRICMGYKVVYVFDYCVSLVSSFRAYLVAVRQANAFIGV